MLPVPGISLVLDRKIWKNPIRIVFGGKLPFILVGYVVTQQLIGNNYFRLATHVLSLIQSICPVYQVVGSIFLGCETELEYRCVAQEYSRVCKIHCMEKRSD